MKMKRIISVILAVLMLSAMIPLSAITASAGGPSMFNVFFDANGGEGNMAPVKVEEGVEYSLPWSDFTPPRGKSFNGWNMGDPGNKIVLHNDITLIATWKDCDEIEVFVKDTNGNVGVGGKVSLGEDYWDTHLIEKYSQSYFGTVILSAQAEEGYSFVGFENSTGYTYSTANPYSFTRPDSPLFTIYAVFEQTKPTLIHQIEVDLMLPYAGTEYNPEWGATAGADASAPYSVTRAFWYDVETGHEPAKFEKGKEYYAEINIVCDGGWALAPESSLLVTVNGYKAANFMIMGNLINIKSPVYVPELYPPILGDADNDGIITVMDVTVIQKKLASIIGDENGRIAMCGDVTHDVLDISDATAIQKYLAHIPVPYKIGESIL